MREYARRGGKLRRREARDLVKIDVNKTSRVWDFLVQAGFMRLGNTDVVASAGAGGAGQAGGSASGEGGRPSATPTLSASPSKESTVRSPRPPPFTTVPLASAGSASNAQYSQPSASWPPPT